MSQVTYRANLSAKTFPYLSTNWGRSIIVSQYDNNFSRSLTASPDSDKDVGTPQIYYCHNVMPHPQGFQSVGYTSILGGLPGVSNFTQTFIIRDDQDNKAQLAFTSDGNAYLKSINTWAFIQNFAGLGNISYTFISGITYIYIQNYGCYSFNFSTNSFTPVTLTGLSGDIIGITGSFGYMIAYTSSAIAWSSTIDPTDFTPSLVTGAGGGEVQSARGSIIVVVSNTIGFIVYTTNNAVAVLYSGNSRFPFNFKELTSSGGVAGPSQVSSSDNFSTQFAYTTSGLQTISSNDTQVVFPDLTDFISGKVFEDYDETAQNFYQVVLSTTMAKQINVVADRYLCISYGISSLTHVLVYDIPNKRWGKLKIPHVQVFEFQLTSPGVTEIPRQSLAFLQSDGTIRLIDFSIRSSTSSGVILLGKYQFVRPRLLQLDEINIENIEAGFTFACYILSAYDGKNTFRTDPYLAASQGEYRKYACRVNALNHSLVFTGAFLFDSLVLVFNIGGKR